jgi:tricorn protease
MSIRTACLFFVLLMLPSTAFAQHEGYYRFPTIAGELLVFSSEGDLWRTHLEGGAAQRLTTHPGEETYPVLSPDGQSIAFSGNYEGTAELYVMPSAGGRPKRLTWDGHGGTRPVSWTADGQVIYRTMRHSGVPNYRLAQVDPESMDRQMIPLSQAADGFYAEDGTLWFVRLPRQGSNSRWYKGGTVQNIWRYGSGDTEAIAMTSDWPGTSKQPRMALGRIYFLSDRGGRGMNVWSMRGDGTDARPHTDYMDWDIQEHTVSGTNLVFRVGADLYRMDLTSDRTEKIPVTLISDFDQQRETWETSPMDYLSSWNVSPDGEKVVLVARGEVYVAPVGKGGRRVFVSRDSGVRYRTARFSSDGTHLLAISDKSGELEWWELSVDGLSVPQQITKGSAMLRLDGQPSPDGKWLAHTDYERNVWLVNLETGQSTRIGNPSPLWSGRGPSVVWSPDSRFIVYETAVANRMASIHIYDVAEETTALMTSDRYEDYSPAFSEDGDWLYFLSDRTLTSSVFSPWGARAPQPHFEKQTKIYAVPLRDSASFPFTRKNELTQGSDSSSTEPASAARLDLGDRIREIPVERGELNGLTVNKTRLFYLSSDNERSLMALDLKPDAEPVKMVEGVSGYELSGDGSKLLVRKGSTLAVIASSAGVGAKLDDGKVDLDGWQVPINPEQEWREIFVDAWRLHRDYFWDPNMLGVDWSGVRAQYEPLVSRVASRQELTDIQGMMVSHLSLLHSSAGGGDTRRGSDNVLPASLGARMERVADGFRVAHVFRTDPDLPGERSPLARLDVAVSEGAVIEAVDGVSTAGQPDIGVLLRGKAGQAVRLGVRDTGGTRRDVIVEPVSLSEESDLRYDEWEYTRRLETEASGDGQIGYVHLRAMGSGNIAEWTREYYPVFDRPGLIIDVRHNNGGNIDSWILGELQRKAWMYFKGRSGDPFWNMHFAFRGHIVVLVDERTASDGEAFADGFRRLDLGDIIGTRTWGGEVWLSSSNRQVDGGVARASEGGVYGPDGDWLIEGWGVVPDETVDNRPHEAFLGKDAQLEAAVRHLQALIEADPRTMPEPPPYPVVVPGDGFPTPYRRTGGR